MTDEEKWRAVVQNNAGWDGRFFYGVKTTKIFCRPSCKSRVPKRNNVAFFDSPPKALAAGYRPCKRCRPDLFEYHPAVALAQAAKDAVDAHFADGEELKKRIALLGVNESYLNKLFSRAYGVTIPRYLRRVRIKGAKQMLREGKKIAECAFLCGFESLSAFYANFKKEAGCPPGKSCDQGKKQTPGRLSEPE